MPKGHSKVSEEDKDKCPFYQMQKDGKIAGNGSSKPTEEKK